MQAPPPSDAFGLIPKGHAVLLFDGVCNLCNASVNFIMDRDPVGYFKMASLQSEVGQALVTRCGLPPEALESVVLIENGACHVRSTAALKIAGRLHGAWPLLQRFLAVPPALRDAVYDWIARNRYRWFGKRDTCRLPTPAERARFLDA